MSRTSEQAINPATQWRMSDWRNPEHYPPNDSALSPDEWRWEFLRRDKQYQEDFQIVKTKFPTKYGIKEWCAPSNNCSPKFYRRKGHIVELIKEGGTEQHLHYLSMLCAQQARGFYFFIDADEPLKPQVKTITDKYNKYSGSTIEPKTRTPRKNNKSPQKTRPLPYLLRVLDAVNAGCKPGEILEIMENEDKQGSRSISETSMRRTIKFAQSIWKKL